MLVKDIGIFGILFGLIQTIWVNFSQSGEDFIEFLFGKEFREYRELFAELEELIGVHKPSLITIDEIVINEAFMHQGQHL